MYNEYKSFSLNSCKEVNGWIPCKSNGYRKSSSPGHQQSQKLNTEKCIGKIFAILLMNDAIQENRNLMLKHLNSLMLYKLQII